MAIFREKIYSSEIKNACYDIANEYGYTVDFHYYDKPTQINYPGDTKLGSLFTNHNVDDLKFTLSDSKRVKKGVCNYIDTKGEIIFHLALKGYQFLLVCKFTPDIINTQVEYDEEDDGDKINYGSWGIPYPEDPFLTCNRKAAR
jgi:hypothetical protein